MNQSKKTDELLRVKFTTSQITMNVFGKDLFLRVERDCKDRTAGRVFLQVVYESPCVNTGKSEEWHGRKWYLSEHMTRDEIIKTSYAAFEAAVNHEVREGFKYDSVALFNPHISYLSLIDIAGEQVRRKDHE